MQQWYKNELENLMNNVFCLTEHLTLTTVGPKLLFETQA